MSNPLISLLAQAEFGAAGLIRRSVDSVVGPIKVKSQEIVGDVVDSTTRTVKTLVIRAIFGVVAAVMAIICIVYLLSALYQALLPRFGPVYAELMIAGLFAVLAIIAVLAMLFWPKAGPAAKPAAKKALTAAETARDKAAADARRTIADADAAVRKAGGTAKAAKSQDPGMDLHSGFDAIISALGDAGFRREQAGLRAGLTLASQLKPMQIVSVALIGGFVAGLRQTSRRRRR